MSEGTKVSIHFRMAQDNLDRASKYMDMMREAGVTSGRLFMALSHVEVAGTHLSHAHQLSVVAEHE